eukprot:CAMPEP_0195296456 /NCGR_PEP_ID=MMETSP0707-20130614/19523_1 /TAXON_ID=33640 /ORGANISM="Asterionellopsis glacialis, Strain CCMP134" /LENGTH=259 /DNA_ID=CAMNT_0040357983 /DNA_START=45 /DNA_END=824 /DNA_ORIENTATION=+
MAMRGGGEENRMPCLFSEEETQFDRYAAAVAATEGLRRMRDKQMSELDGGTRESKKLERSAAKKAAQIKNVQDEAQKRIAAEYVMRSNEVLKAMGMTVPQFNQLGRLVGQDKKLKEKVMEQAYLYRMTATLDMERVPLIEDPATKDLLKATRQQRVEMFCESMSDIEQLRSDQMARLKKALKVEKLPKNVQISDPAVMPFLSAKVRAVLEAFPLQAEEIVKQYGLNSDEFNEMLEETKSNPIFRYKVQKYMKSHKGSRK